MGGDINRVRHLILSRGVLGLPEVAWLQEALEPRFFVCQAFFLRRASPDCLFLLAPAARQALVPRGGLLLDASRAQLVRAYHR